MRDAVPDAPDIYPRKRAECHLRKSPENRQTPLLQNRFAPNKVVIPPERDHKVALLPALKTLGCSILEDVRLTGPSPHEYVARIDTHLADLGRDAQEGTILRALELIQHHMVRIELHPSMAVDTSGFVTNNL